MTSSDTASGLMAFWADIDADYLERYREWHNCEHIPERLAVPGFVEARRYVGAGAPTRFLMTYVTRSPEVLRSKAYLEALSRPTAWTQEALPHFRNPVRNIYRLVDEAGRAGLLEAPYVTALRASFDELPELGQGPLQEGVARLRLYEIDAEASNIKTKEREIYRGGPGAEPFLLLVERRTPVAADAGLAAVLGADLGGAVEGAARDLTFGHFWIDYAARAASDAD